MSGLFGVSLSSRLTPRVVQVAHEETRNISAVDDHLKLTHGDAAKNLDWLSCDPQAPTVLGRTAEAE